MHVVLIFVAFDVRGKICHVESAKNKEIKKNRIGKTASLELVLIVSTLNDVASILACTQQQLIRRFLMSRQDWQICYS